MHRSIRYVWPALVVLLIPALSLTAAAQEFVSPFQKNSSVSGYVAFFQPARESFRDIYGSDFSFAVAVRHRLLSNMQVGVKAAYFGLDATEPDDLEYVNWRISPVAYYLLSQGERQVFYVGAGIGLNFRQIQGKIPIFSQGSTIARYDEVTQDDFGPSLLIVVGTDYALMSMLTVGAEIDFDYIYDSEPELGDFGNTGGFGFNLTIGYPF